MSLQMNMKMDGIVGESKSFSHKGWTDVLSWNWGMTSTRKIAHGMNGDKTNLNELSIIKAIGTDSADIRLCFAQGKIIPNVEFSVVPVVGKRERVTKYLNIKMEEVMIKSIVTGGSNEDSFFKEHITLLFARIEFEYSKTGPSGSDGSSGETENFGFGWNVTEDTEWKQ